MLRGKWIKGWVAGAVLLGSFTVVKAQDEKYQVAAAETQDKVSGAIGVDYASHFVSYGLDVWGEVSGEGTDLYGSDSTTFVWTEVSWDLNPFAVTVGVWGDINDNLESSIGGSIQEIDVYAGLGYTYDRYSLGITYQEWNYASDVERIVDLSAAVDDTGLLFENFAFNPSVVWHIRTDGNGAQEEGSAVVLSIEPGFTLIDSEDYPVSLSIPAGVGLFLDDDFQGGTQDGYAYSFVGTTVSMPLAFIDEEYGDWSIAGSLKYYMTDEEAIPGNPDENFLTGMVSLQMSF